MELTVQGLTNDGVVAELACSFNRLDLVTEILGKIPGLANRLTSFTTMSPIQYWEYVVQELGKGIVKDGLEQLLVAAAAFYPDNGKFRPYAALNRIGRPSAVSYNVQPSPPVTNTPSVFVATDATDNKSVRWHGSSTLGSFIESCWGYYEQGNHTRPAEVAYAPALTEHSQLAYSLIRLGIHGGIRTLRVRDPKTWNNQIDKSMPGCMGYRTIRDWVPTQEMPTTQQWGVQTLLPETTPTEEYQCVLLAAQLAEELNRQMDEWTLRRLDKLVSDVVSDGGFPLLQMKIAAEFLVPIRDEWKKWREDLTAKCGTNHRFLRIMLATSTSLDSPASGLRIGPRTADTCLLQGTIFALATAVATRRTVPRVGPRNNLEHAGEAAHLLALELIDGYELQDRFATLTWESGYAFLAGEKGNVTDLSAMSRKFSEPDEALVTVNRRDLSNVRLVTRDAGFRKALGCGLDALAEYLQAVFKAQERAAEQLLKQSSDVGV